jgi:hypothetical protein
MRCKGESEAGSISEFRQRCLIHLSRGVLVAEVAPRLSSRVQHELVSLVARAGISELAHGENVERAASG